MKKLAKALWIEKNEGVYIIGPTAELQDDVGTVGFVEFSKKDKLEIDLDGTSGLGPAFLEEAFGGMIRGGYDYGQLMSIFVFKSDEVPYYVDDIKKYLEEASYAQG